MALSISLAQAEPTFLGALTTTFTPPSSCFGTTAAVDSDGIPFQMHTGGVADALYIASGNLHTECYPSAYPATVGNFGAYFSPGVCPSGYTTAATMSQGSETRAICCVIGLTANDLLNCQTSITNKVLTASQFWTIEPGPLHPIETGSVKSGSSLDLIGSAIEIRYRAGENPAPTIQPQTSHSTTSYNTFVPTNTGDGASFSQTRTTQSLIGATSTSGPSEALSEGAKIAIGVAVPVAVLALVGALGAVYLQRRSARLKAARTAQ